MIGSLMYFTNTRPDICFVVNTLSQYMVEPRHVHLIEAKHVMRYLKGIVAALYTPGLSWKKSSIHWVCPWGQVSSQGVVT
jgi:hypothetical protein